MSKSLSSTLPHEADDLAFLDRPPLVGRRFGHVRIDSLIDRGGMGEVYRGFDEALERRVAVKAIRPEQRPQQEARSRFHREARLLSKLEHPNVCRIYDLYGGDQETGDLLILELVEGRKLGDVLKRGLRFEQKLRIAEQIASALEAAHSLQIIHRDLKPSNVMIKASGRAKVLDFGLARSLENPSDPPSSPSFAAFSESGDDSGVSRSTRLEVQTNHQYMVGTLAFMSPEQAVGEPLTEASDLYSLGLLLQWLFTETSPYGADTSRLDLLRRVLQGDTLPCRTQDSDLTLLIEGLKHPNPERRPTATECLSQLHEIVGKPVRRRFRRTLISVVMILLLIGSALFLVNHRRTERREELMLAFTHEAKDVEWLMRLAHSLPLQELTPHRSDVRRRMGSMVGLLQIAGGLGRGPGNFALGRGHLALGETDRAESYLQAAWDNQYRHPEVGFAFAMVRARQFEDARAELALVTDPGWRAHRTDWMNRRFRDEVLAYLRVAKGTGGGVPIFVEALVALFEQRRQDAAQALIQSRERVPWLYEASAWSSALELDIAREELEVGQAEEALSAFIRASEHLAAAARVGSSDPRLHLASCRLWNEMLASAVLDASFETAAGDSALFHEDPRLATEQWRPTALFSRALAACDRSIRASPDLSAARLEKSRSMGWLALDLAEEGQAAEARKLLESALEAQPEVSPDALEAASVRWQSWAFGTMAQFRIGAKEDPIQNLLAAVEQADLARELDSDDPAGLWLQTQARQRLAEWLIHTNEDPRSTLDGLEQILRQAVRKDRNLAIVYLELARTHGLLARYQINIGESPKPTLDSGRTAAAKAQNLEPDNPRADELLTELDALKDGRRPSLGAESLSLNEGNPE